jgi:hypothetical protein
MLTHLLERRLFFVNHYYIQEVQHIHIPEVKEIIFMHRHISNNLRKIQLDVDLLVILGFCSIVYGASPITGRDTP